MIAKNPKIPLNTLFILRYMLFTLGCMGLKDTYMFVVTLESRYMYSQFECDDL